MADIKEITNRWLARNTKTKGVIACGVRYPDETTFNQTSSTNFSTLALDNSWKCVSSTFQFLKQQQKEVDQMCWVFENYLLYCAVRSDDVCLGVFTSKKDEEHDAAIVNRMISEFKALRGAEKTAK